MFVLLAKYKNIKNKKNILVYFYKFLTRSQFFLVRKLVNLSNSHYFPNHKNEKFIQISFLSNVYSLQWMYEVKENGRS